MMSNSSDRSTESEDGEIEREKKYRRSVHKRPKTHKPGHELKRKRKDKSPDLQEVSDDNNSNVEEEYEEIDDFDDIVDENGEEGLEIKTPQQKATTSSRHKSYVTVSSNYHRSDKSSKDSNRLTTDSPNKQRDHRFRERHRNRSKYSDSRRSDDEIRRKRRTEDIQQDLNQNKSRSSGRDKPTDRWMVLDDKNYSSDNSRSKITEESHRSHREKRRDATNVREKSLKSDKDIYKFVTTSPVSSPIESIKPIKKSNALIEVQEVVMSEEELISEEQNTPSERSESKASNEISQRSDSVSSEHNDSHSTEDNEEEVLTPKKVIESELKNPRIVVDREVIYYSESDVVHKETVELVEDMSNDLPDYFPAIQGCRSVEEFQCINRIEEGTYGVVYRARDKRTDETVALKRLKMEKEKEGFPITSLREISTLLKAQHENIVTVKEIVVGSNMDKIYIVMEFVEHDLKSLMETMKQPFLLGEVKTLMQQLLRAVAHLHDNWILHRDLKTSNLLLSHRGILKVGDFGLAREYGSPLKAYTPIVVTLWYRAPELLLQARQYSYPIDIWSVGCIFGELLTMKPLFPGKSEIDQLNHIFKDLGTPNDTIWPDYSQLPLVKKVMFTEHKYNNLLNRFGQKLTKLGFDLINRFLTYCPSRRITAEEALKHEFFNESPLPVDPSMFPTWPAKSELGVGGHTRKAQSPKPPSGGKQFAKQLAGDDDEKLVAETQGFRMTLPNQGKASKGGGFNLKF